MKRPLIEVISTSPSDSKVIQDTGADRIQLVSALQIGGLTPSPTIIRKSLEIVDIPTMVMVRHHNQGFIHNQQQTLLLRQEVCALKDFGVRGIVIGGITPEGKVDQKFVCTLLQQINVDKIDVTFHKASDQTINLSQTYQVLERHKIFRVLTQGGLNGVLQNKGILLPLISESKVVTLIGGGVSHSNIVEIVQQLRPRQIHVGTCVRVKKYGVVDGVSLSNLLERIKY